MGVWGTHAAAAFVGAAPVLDALAVRQLVTQTALETAAHPRQLRRVEAEVLLLGHLDRDGLERLQPRRATEWAAARPVPAQDTRLVADADLPHLDPRVEVRGKIAHQFPEVHAPFRRVVEDEPRAVEQLLDARQLHLKPAFADLQQTDPGSLLLALLVPKAREHVFPGSAADDVLAGVRRGRFARGGLGDGARDRRNGRSLRGLNDHAIAGRGHVRRRVIHRQIGQQKRVSAADRRELHAEERACRLTAHDALF